GALVCLRGTAARSWAGSCSVPHCPCCLLKTSFQLLSASRRAKRLYSPFGIFTSPNKRSVAVVKVVDLSAPSRQTLPGFRLSSNCCTVRPFKLGRPYSTEMAFPFKVSFEVPRGLPCAAKFRTKATKIAKPSVAVKSLFIVSSIWFVRLARRCLQPCLLPYPAPP